MALKLSGMAAKNFALFVYAVLKDQKKTHGKTRLVRMLREQRPFKFFNVPTENMKEFATEAKTHGLLYVPIRNKQKADRIEVVVFADDASKVQRIFDNLGLDAVKAQAGEATIASVQEQEKQAPAAPAPDKTETVKTEQGEVEFEVGGFEDDFNIGPTQQDTAEIPGHDAADVPDLLPLEYIQHGLARRTLRFPVIRVTDYAAIPQKIAPAVMPRVIVFLFRFLNAGTGLRLCLHLVKMGNKPGSLFRKLAFRVLKWNDILCHSQSSFGGSQSGV